MVKISEEQANTEWAKFSSLFESLGLSQNYDMDELRKEILDSPCALTEDMGTAYAGALLVHINMTMALAQRISKMISGTFQIEEPSLLKVIALMHLSKRHMYVANEEEWGIKKGIMYKFRNTLEGCLKGGERSALEALNNGVKLSPVEFEAIKALDNADNDGKNNPYTSIMTTIVRQANELAYAIEKGRYAKLISEKNG